MTISIVADNESVDVKLNRFSDGGTNIKIDFPEVVESFISVSIENEPVDTYHYHLAHIGGMIRQKYGQSGISVIAHLPYFPHARADRAFEDGMGVPANTILDVVEKYYTELKTYDVHSISPFIHTVVQHDDRGQANLFSTTIDREHVTIPENTAFIAPDKGAVQKTRLVSNVYKLPMFTCDKVRDVSTGRIVSITSNFEEDDIKGKTCIITDDICDGGMTFIKTADFLKDNGAKEVWLYVTHGIFSKGLDALSGNVDKILCYQTVNNHVTNEEIREWNNK